MPSDRIREIRARLDAATPGPFAWHGCPQGDADFLSNAPADIAWLLDELVKAYSDADEAISLLSTEPRRLI